MRRLIPLIFLAVLAAGCGSSTTGGQDAADTSVTVSETAPVTTDPTAATDPTVTTEATADSVGEGVEDRTSDGLAGVATLGPLWEGGCGSEHVALEPYQVVFDVPADDPDGGLNLRAEPVDGEVLGVLANGEVVWVLDCSVADDGGVWWLVEDRFRRSGFVNRRWLTDDLALASDGRFRGASEAEERVEWLLASLDGEDWTGALEALGPAGERLVFGGDLDAAADAEVLARYCEVWTCDATFDIVDVRGVLDVGWGRPEVDVRFDYDGGSVVQTFGLLLESSPGTTTDGLVDYAMVGVYGLPGRSIHGLRSAPATTADLLVRSGDPADADPGLVAAAEEVRQALLSEDGPRLPAARMAPEGVVIEIDAYVDPEPSARVAVTVDDLRGGDRPVLWGFADGTGFPVVATVDDHLGRYRRDLALLDPDVVGIDERIGVGTTIANLGEVFPDSRVVEYHREARGDIGLGWGSVRMAFEQRDGEWVLVALTPDFWTT